MKLTNNEQWILDYLKGKDYVCYSEDREDGEDIIFRQVK